MSRWNEESPDLELGLNLDEEEPLHVFDLPQIHTKPSARLLLDSLSLLKVQPRSWDGTPPRTPGSSTPRSRSGASTLKLLSKKRVDPEGVPHYLTRIISSPLNWISDDESKEEVWNAASVRLSERSGRTAMGNMSRAFTIPTYTEPNINEGARGNVPAFVQGGDASLEIQIYEPALTADDLGLKTWASSFVLARKWCTLGAELDLLRSRVVTSPVVLELGAGTGLVGIAAAAVLGHHVILTDLPAIVSNLARNVNENLHLIESRGGSATVAVLDWTEPENISFVRPAHASVDLCTQRARDPGAQKGLSVPLIVAADPIYSMDHPRLLASAINCHLERSADARVIVQLPIRDAFAEERHEFVTCMHDIGLHVVGEKSEVGYDDWSEGYGEELREVQCWMTIWAWKQV